MSEETKINLDISFIPADLITGLNELKEDYKFSLPGKAVLTVKKGVAGIRETQNGFEITYTKKCEFYREFVKLIGGKTDIREERVFDSIGVMLDCSRNAVLKVSAVKKYVRLLACMGYDTLMLYTEDTYEIESEPYFGYLRGRYTKAELREIDSYARIFGIELVPCIQTLAHVNAVTRWERFKPIIDCNDILLIGDNKTYELIDKMFKTLAECFTSRKVHIGMDEAHMVGLGKYLDEHGYQNRFDLLYKHMKRVLEIADKYGFACTMWSDMFFRLACKGAYEPSDSEMPKSVKDIIPKNLTLMYWDYYRNDKSEYNKMLATHKQLTDKISFAGGAWRWSGFAPKNTMSVNRTELALDACKEHGVKDILMTVWGDDGCECSAFSVLPTLVYVAERAYRNDDYKKAFERIVGINYDDFIALEFADDVLPNKSKFYGSKLMTTMGDFQANELTAAARFGTIPKRNNRYIIYTIDTLKQAIANNKKVSFQYYSLDYKKNKVYRKGGERYVVNPLVVVWNKDNYYLVCYYDNHDNTVTYRIDRMEEAKEEAAERAYRKEFDKFDIEQYRQSVFSMFGGEEQEVDLQFDSASGILPCEHGFARSS